MTVERKDYLATMAIVSVLILQEVDDEGTDFNYTNPLWMATLTSWLSEVCWYAFLLSILGAVTTTFFAVLFRTNVCVVSPTLWLVFGLVLYLIEVIVDQYVTAYKRGTLDWPDSYNAEFYASYVVPSWAFVVVWPLYTVYLYFAGGGRGGGIAALQEEAHWFKHAEAHERAMHRNGHALPWSIAPPPLRPSAGGARGVAFSHPRSLRPSACVHGTDVYNYGAVERNPFEAV